MIQTDVSHSCIRLTNISRQRLLKIANNLDELYSAEIADYILIKLGEQDVSLLPLGEEIQIKVVGYAHEKGLQCVHVEFEHEGIDIDTKWPHIVVSYSRDKTVRNSNKLMEETNGGLPLSKPVTLLGKVGYFKRSPTDTNFYQS